MGSYKMFDTDRWRCPRCGAKRDAKANLCAACYKVERAKDIPDPVTIKRVLDRFGWNFSAAGRYFRVSDNAVRKWCRKYDIRQQV